MKTNLTLLTILASILWGCGNGANPPYEDTALSFEERAADLVSRMTLEEKVSQLTYTAAAVERFGIPEYNWWNEGLHGVARAGKATVFPQAIGMAATFDRQMMHDMADVTSTEARAKYNGFVARDKRGIYQGLTFWSPNINIFRDPRWGRGHETYGEDPYLTGEMAVEFIRGLQGEDPRYLKTVATAKHYVVHSGPEPGRHSFNAVVSERDFRDTYLPAFRQSVMEGGAWSVMCAYNRTQGEPCCGSSHLLGDILRGELGFPGYVVSDCGAIYDFHWGHKVVADAIEASALGLMSGTDLNCGDQYPALVAAVEQGLVPEADVDTAVTRLMVARMKLGMFDPSGMVPWSDLGPGSIASKEHRKVALDMARKSMVLLKNDRNQLPLDPSRGKIAVIGPNADNAYVQYGNYNGTAAEPVSVLDGILQAVGDSSRVRFALGSPHHEGMPYLVPVPPQVLFQDPSKFPYGLLARYYRNTDATGDPVFERSESRLDVHWWDGEPPVEGLTDDAYSVTWDGYLIPRRSGTHALGVYGKYVTLVVDGDTLIRMHNEHHPVKTFENVNLVAGKSYAVKVIMADLQGDADCSLHWQEPDVPLMEEALQVASWADQIVLVVGLTARLEGEEMRGLELDGFSGGDRTSLDLPDVQRRLIRRLLATGKPVTLVLMSGSAVSLKEDDLRPGAILQAWYGGETAGQAVADVLFGGYNPAGRLPVTFYRSVEDLPPFGEYGMDGRTYRYFEGDVLYPFGYGLSYTTFSYNNLLLEKSEMGTDQSILVSVEVTNTGSRDGEEVIQMYLRGPEGDSGAPLRSLKGFERIRIKAGQRVVVTLPLGPQELERFDEERGEYRVFPGEYEVMVGPSSDPSALKGVKLRVGS
ncbi:MAG: glycoside hydrolase family 3 C-terminal domain-containing protein [Bacteroidales bacterium]